MPTGFPASYDNLNNPDSSAGDDLDTPGVEHDDQHANANDAIEAIEHTLGLNPQAGYADVKERIAAAEAAAAAAAAAASDKVGKAGDTMTGALVLPEDPTAALEAATKQYVDTQDAAVVASVRPRFPLLEQAVGWWDARVGLTEDGDLRDLSGRGNDLVLTAGSPGGGAPTGPAYIAPDPARGRSLFSPGWDDMWWESDAPGSPITEVDVAVEVDPTKQLELTQPSPDNWLVHQGSTADGSFSWAVGIEAGSGRGKVAYSEDGTTVTIVTSDVEVWDSGYTRLAFTLDASTGDVSFYTQPFTDPIDDFESAYSEWTLVEVVSGAGPVTLFDSSAPIRHQTTVDPDEIDGDLLNGWHTSLYRARIRHDVGGFNAAYLDTDLIPTVPEWDVVSGLPAVGSVDSAAVTEFLGRTGEVWSIWNYQTESYPIVILDHPLVLFGNESYATAGVDDASFSIPDDSDFSAWVVYASGRGGLGFGAFAAVQNFDTPYGGWSILSPIGEDRALGVRLRDNAGGGPALTPDAGNIATPCVAGFNLDRSTPAGSGSVADDEYQTLVTWMNGQSSVPSDVTLGSLATEGIPLTVGAWGDAGSPGVSFGLIGLAIFHRKLTDWEVRVSLPYEFGLSLLAGAPFEDEPWIDFTLLNGWVAVAGLPTPGWRLKDGALELRGALNGSASSAAQFGELTGDAVASDYTRVVGTSATDDLTSFAGASVLVSSGSGPLAVAAFRGAADIVLLDGISLSFP